MSASLDPAVVERFTHDLDALVPRDAPMGIAVSGGADSMALLALAHHARPGMVKAVTVDHGLRPESGEEARQVARCCVQLGVSHQTLAVAWPDGPPTSNVEARSREARYERLRGWAIREHLGFVATGHHADDQAETLLMRLARGSGLSGMAGIRAIKGDRDHSIVRPLLRWTRAELAQVADSAGMPIAHDPHNEDPSFDRARLRAALAAAGFEDAGAYAATAEHLAEAEAALQWMLFEVGDRALSRQGDAVRLDLAGIPRELRRRLLATAVHLVDGKVPRGPALMRAMQAVEAGGKISLGATCIHADGNVWTIAPAPPRRGG